MNVRGMFGNAVGVNQNQENSAASHLWPLGGDNRFGDFEKVFISDSEQNWQQIIPHTQLLEAGLIRTRGRGVEGGELSVGVLLCEPTHLPKSQQPVRGQSVGF